MYSKVSPWFQVVIGGFDLIWSVFRDQKTVNSCTLVAFVKKPYLDTLQGTNISHLGKRNIIFNMPLKEDMLVPWRVIFVKDRKLEMSMFTPCRTSETIPTSNLWVPQPRRYHLSTWWNDRLVQPPHKLEQNCTFGWKNHKCRFFPCMHVMSIFQDQAKCIRTSTMIGLYPEKDFFSMNLRAKLSSISQVLHHICSIF